jgi:hypothetical protein
MITAYLLGVTSGAWLIVIAMLLPQRIRDWRNRRRSS